MFDLDDTLYAPSTGVMARVHARIDGYVAVRLGLEPEKARTVRRGMLERYGSTMLGMMAMHGTTPEDYVEYCHDIEVGLGRDDELGAALAALPGRKIIHTNAPAAWARRVLGALGIAEHLSGIFDIADAGWRPKPDLFGYEGVARRFSLDPERCCMFEDTPANLEPAFASGMMTVLVHGPGCPPTATFSHVDHRTGNLADWLRRFSSPGC